MIFFGKYRIVKAIFYFKNFKTLIQEGWHQLYHGEKQYSPLFQVSHGCIKCFA